MRVGVVAVQGDFLEHEIRLREQGHEVWEIRRPKDIAPGGNPPDMLVFPGGESTVQRKLLADQELAEPLGSLIDGGVQVMATCAGLILLAKQVDGRDSPWGRLDVAVKRNAYGRQLGSFVHGDQVFIRAPAIESVGPGVETLSSIEGRPTAVRQGNITAYCYHPELAGSGCRCKDTLAKNGKI